MDVLTAANQLTLLRLLLVPVFALCMLYGRPGWALVVFAVAGATDALRRLHRAPHGTDDAGRLAGSDGGQTAAGHDVRDADAAGAGPDAPDCRSG